MGLSAPQMAAVCTQAFLTLERSRATHLRRDWPALPLHQGSVAPAAAGRPEMSSALVPGAGVTRAVFRIRCKSTQIKKSTSRRLERRLGLELGELLYFRECGHCFKVNCMSMSRRPHSRHCFKAICQ